MVAEAQKLADEGDVRGAIELARRANQLWSGPSGGSSLTWQGEGPTPATLLLRLESIERQRQAVEPIDQIGAVAPPRLPHPIPPPAAETDATETRGDDTDGPSRPMTVTRDTGVLPAAAPPETSLLATFFVNLMSTLAGLLLAIVALVAVRFLVLRRFGVDIGLALAATQAGDRQHATALADNTGPDDSDAPPSVPMFDSGAHVSAYEEQLQAEEEAEQAILEHVFQQNVQLRHELSAIGARQCDRAA